MRAADLPPPRCKISLIWRFCFCTAMSKAVKFFEFNEFVLTLWINFFTTCARKDVPFRFSSRKQIMPDSFIKHWILTRGVQHLGWDRYIQLAGAIFVVVLCLKFDISLIDTIDCTHERNWCAQIKLYMRLCTKMQHGMTVTKPQPCLPRVPNLCAQKMPDVDSKVVCI